MRASDFEGCVRCYHTASPRDVAPCKVPVQFLDRDGRVLREVDLDERLVATARRLARRQRHTLNQMLARMLFEQMIKEGGLT